MRPALLAVAILALVACSPKIDTSTDEKMKVSMEEVRSSLPAERRGEFDKALQTIAYSKLGGAMADVFDGGAMPQPEKVAGDLKSSLEGKTAEDVLALAAEIQAEQEAKQRQQALQEIGELEKSRANAERARAELRKFQVLRSRFSVGRDYFGMAEPIISLTVKNGTPHAVSRVYFTGTLASPGRSVPWLKEDFNYEVAGGLEPGEEASWRLAPNPFSEWGTVEAPADAILTAEVVRIEGPDGKELLSATGFTEEDAARLEALRKQFGR